MGIEEVLGTSREAILRITGSYGARNVRIFGSVARGNARPDSDLDILVDFQGEQSLFDHIRLSLELESVAGRRVDIATESELRPGHRERVLREAVAL